MMRPQSLYQSLAHVPKQMPTVGDLHGLRRGFGGRFGIQGGAIAADDLRTGMFAKPLFRALGATVRQQIDHLAAFQVAKDRSIAMPLAPRPVIDTQNSRRPCAIDECLSEQLPQ